MTVLDEICARKRDQIRRDESRTPLAALKQQIDKQSPVRGFKKKIQALSVKKRPALISEIKKASPSGGLIRADFNPAVLAKAYEEGGAACLSVLTDAPYFQGRNEDLMAARQACALPVLRKDFMLMPWQIYESRAIGADCVLLIMAVLTNNQARELLTLSRILTMDALVEVHDETELKRAIALGADMIGVNNRSLKTLKVDLRTGVKLAPLIPDGVIRIAESGINAHEELLAFHQVGYHGFLVGESLMRQEDVTQAARTLLTGRAEPHEGLDKNQKEN